VEDSDDNLHSSMKVSETNAGNGERTSVSLFWSGIWVIRERGGARKKRKVVCAFKYSRGMSTVL
jgi:hypothetical protein